MQGDQSSDVEIEKCLASFNLARLKRKGNNVELAQQHYNRAHPIFQELGAAKELERIERE